MYGQNLMKTSSMKDKEKAHSLLFDKEPLLKLYLQNPPFTIDKILQINISNLKNIYNYTKQASLVIDWRRK